jgi:hypothetical protein
MKAESFRPFHICGGMGYSCHDLQLIGRTCKIPHFTLKNGKTFFLYLFGRHKSLIHVNLQGIIISESKDRSLFRLQSRIVLGPIKKQTPCGVCSLSRSKRKVTRTPAGTTIKAHIRVFWLTSSSSIPSRPEPVV